MQDHHHSIPSGLGHPQGPQQTDALANIRKRRWLQGAVAVVGLQWLPAWAQDKGSESKPPRMGRNLPADLPLREMQILKLKDIGLEVWVENQPPWDAQTVQHNGRPVFSVSSPENYHPPTAMTFASWPEHKVSLEQLENVAHSALRHASQNFGLTQGQARAMAIRPQQHGVLSGYEAEFVGKLQGMVADVHIFFGLQAGHPPVVMTVYTLKGKMGNLKDVIRRSWDNVSYLN